MWGCGILCAAWTVCDQVSLSSTPFAFPTIQEARFIFDRREWGQDIERRREWEREERERTLTDKMISPVLGMNRDPSPCSSSLSVIGLGVGFWPIPANLTKACLPGVSQKIFLTDRGLFTGRETHFFSTPFLLACDPILWDRKPEHTRGHSLASMSGDVASTSGVAEWKGRGTLSP